MVLGYRARGLLAVMTMGLTRRSCGGGDDGAGDVCFA